MSNRSCVNAVSWCEGPDRYGEICKACLETWTNETQVTHWVGDKCEPNGHRPSGRASGRVVVAATPDAQSVQRSESER